MNGQTVRTWLTSVAIAIVGFLPACSRSQDPTPPLENLARGPQEIWPARDAALRLRLSVDTAREGLVLRCRLENVSEQPVEIDASTLPWRTPGFFDVDAVTRDGRILRRNANVLQISAPPHAEQLAPGASLEGVILLTQLPIQGLPAREDVLLLWSYTIAETHWLSGVTRVPGHRPAD